MANPFPHSTTDELRAILKRESVWPLMCRSIEHEKRIADEIERREKLSHG